LGTDGADSHSDGGTAKTLVAGAGDDVLTATAASVLYGGAGMDTFNINAAMVTALENPMGSGGNVDRLARVDGGSGIDTLALTGGGLILDFTQIANQAGGNPVGGSRLSSIEKIDLTGSGDNTLKLKASDVFDLSEANVFETTGRHQLMVTGDAGDKVHFAEGQSGAYGWTQAGTALVDSVSYQVWNNNHSLDTLYLSANVSILVI
jgi:hypothetical protein